MCSIGSRIKVLRIKRGLSATALADKLGISRSIISKYENNHRKPGRAILFLLSDFFGVSIDYILCRTDMPNIDGISKKISSSDFVKYVDYIEILKDAGMADISPGELREVIEFTKKIKNKE